MCNFVYVTCFRCNCIFQAKLKHDRCFWLIKKGPICLEPSRNYTGNSVNVRIWLFLGKPAKIIYTLGFALIFKKLSFHFHLIYVHTSDNQAIKSWMSRVRVDIGLFEDSREGHRSTRRRNDERAWETIPKLSESIQPRSTPCSALQSFPLCFMPYVTVHVLQYPVHCYSTQHMLQCPVHMLQCFALYCTMYSVHCSALKCTVHSVL